MDTLLKHNKEIEENIENNYFLKQWTSVKGANEELTRHLKHLITSQNTELLKKIAKGEIERLTDEKDNVIHQVFKHKIVDAKLTSYCTNARKIAIQDQITHWQQVLQDLEK